MPSTTDYSPEFLAQDRSQRVVNVSIIFGVLETIFVFLFFFSRYKNRIGSVVDTYLMVPAYLTAFSHIILCNRKPLSDPKSFVYLSWDEFLMNWTQFLSARLALGAIGPHSRRVKGNSFSNFNLPSKYFLRQQSPSQSLSYYAYIFASLQ
jgi:hypothetical protein